MGLLKWFEGKRTYLCAAGLFLTFGAEGMGWLPPEVASWLKGIFGGGGLAALRLAKGKS